MTGRNMLIEPKIGKCKIKGELTEAVFPKTKSIKTFKVMLTNLNKAWWNEEAGSLICPGYNAHRIYFFVCTPRGHWQALARINGFQGIRKMKMLLVNQWRKKDKVIFLRNIAVFARVHRKWLRAYHVHTFVLQMLENLMNTTTLTYPIVHIFIICPKVCWNEAGCN